MISNAQNNEKVTEHRALVTLKLLWKKFNKQTPKNRVITLLVILITIAWIGLFYLSYVLWQVFSFVMTKIILWAIEWYLHWDDEKERRPE